MDWQLLLGGLIAVGFAVVCSKNLRWGITLFCALLPAYVLRYAIPLPGLQLPTTLLEILFGILFVAWLFSKKDRGRRRLFAHQWALPLTVLLAAAVISTAVSPDMRAALGLLRAYFLEPIAFFAIFATTVVTDTDRRRVIGAMAATTALIGISAAAQEATGFGIPDPWHFPTVRRITSIFGFPNAVGLLLAPLVVLLAGRSVDEWRHGSRHESVLYGMIAALGIAACVFAESEGALLGIAVGLGVLGLLTKPLQKWTLAAGLAASLVVVAVPMLRDYAITAGTLNDAGGSVRKIIWKETTNMLADSPLLGAGLSGYPKGIEPYHQAKHIEIFQYPHNSVLNTWSELGILGMIAFGWLIILFFRRAAALRKHPSHAWLMTTLIGAMIGLLVHGLVDVPYFKNDLAFLWWILFGLLASTMLQEAKIPEAEKPLPTLPRR